MLVSIVTPTRDRADLLPSLYASMAHQHYTQIEHLICDDSPEPNLFLQRHPDPRLRYIHLPQRTSVGNKRDLMNEMARGEVIVHFDDDDYYAPTYVHNALNMLVEADFAKLSGWFNYNRPYKIATYWDTSEAMSQTFVLGPRHQPQTATVSVRAHEESYKWGYGFSYAYRKAAVGAVRFGDRDFGEDFHFFGDLRERGARCVHAADTVGQVVHIIHNKNLSRVFGQYRVPVFVLRRTFGSAFDPYL